MYITILLRLIRFCFFLPAAPGSNMYSIDLNSDMGESFGAYKLGGDEEIIKYVTTANVACGWHAGDPMVMDKASPHGEGHVALWLAAHPGYPDLLGFGRRKDGPGSRAESQELRQIPDRRPRLHSHRATV